MAASNQQLGFAIRAVNEANRALKDVQDQLGDVEGAASKASKSMDSAGVSLAGVGEAGGNAEQALRGVSDLTSFMGDQFGLQIGPLDKWTGALANVGGGIEAVVKGGPARLKQIAGLPATIAPANGHRDR